MNTHRELEIAFFEGRRDPIELPFVVNDAVELQFGLDAGMRGSLVAAFFEDDCLMYTVELSNGKDIQVTPTEISLIAP